MSSKRGVTPILSVIILIGIAVTGGVLLNEISQQFILSSFGEIEYKVTDLSLEKDSQDECYLSVSLYNSGTMPITQTLISVTLDNGERWSPSNIESNNIDSNEIVDPGGKFAGFVAIDRDDGDTVCDRVDSLPILSDDDFKKELEKEVCPCLTIDDSYSFRITAISNEENDSFVKNIPVKVKAVDAP